MGLTDLLKTNMERHPETFGDALQLFQRDVFPATRYGIQVGTFHVQYLCQFCFTHVFFNIAFFKSIFVSFFITQMFKIYDIKLYKKRRLRAVALDLLPQIHSFK